MQSARNAKVVQPTDPAKRRVLPNYYFPVNIVNATPGVSRFMSYEVIKEDQVKEIIKIVESGVVVFNRPKAFVGSSGSMWVSEYMKMRQSDTVMFSAEKKTTVCGLIYYEFGQKFMNEKSVFFLNLFMTFVCHFVHLFVGLSISMSLGINSWQRF